MLPPAKQHLSSRGLGDSEGQGQVLPWSLPRGLGPANTLIPQFWPPEVKENAFLLFQPTKFVTTCYSSPRRGMLGGASAHTLGNTSADECCPEKVLGLEIAELSPAERAQRCVLQTLSCAWTPGDPVKGAFWVGGSGGGGAVCGVHV